MPHHHDIKCGGACSHHIPCAAHRLPAADTIAGMHPAHFPTPFSRSATGMPQDVLRLITNPTRHTHEAPTPACVH